MALLSVRTASRRSTSAQRSDWYWLAQLLLRKGSSCQVGWVGRLATLKPGSLRCPAMSEAAAVRSRDVVPNLSAAHWLLRAWTGNDRANAGLHVSSDASSPSSITITTWCRTLSIGLRETPIGLVRLTGSPPARRDLAGPVSAML